MKGLITGLSTAAAGTFLLVSVSSGAIPPPLAQSAKPFLGNSQTTVAPTPSSLPAGFSDSVVFSGLTNPTNVRFSPDGRVFVAEKSGLLKVFDNLSDATPTQVVDLRQEVDDFWDRGMLGLALDPNFPTTPYVYLLYTYDGGPGQTAPVWNDGCPTPPGPTTDGCVVTGKLVRLQLSANSVVGSTTLISGEWCQQFPSHSIGDLNFGPDGNLYVTGGDGASFDFVDYGQAGGHAGSPTPLNPCGDPPAGVGGTEVPPTAEGGALRSQSVRRPTGEPVLLDGALLRVDPATGAGAAGNPLASSTSANARRIVAYGMRNPFRFVFRPGTNEVWIGDVGWNDWEEIDRLLNPTVGPANFGWPCYEGNGRQAGYQSANLNVCNSLYSAGTAVAPYYTYSHGSSVVPGDGCSTANGSVISALSFYAGSRYPSEYNGALFFGDHSRNCIWAMMPGTNGLPDPSNIRLLEAAAANPVDIEPGPGGDLYYVDFDGGKIHRISYGSTVTCSAGTWDAQYFNNTTLSGAPALEQCESSINHDWGSGSPAPGISADGFSVRWSGQFSFPGGSTTFNVTADDGIRLFLDGTPLIDEWRDQSATFNVTTTVPSGMHTVTIEYYDDTGPAVARATWQAAGTDTAPVPVIDTPSSSLTYAVGDAISFSGRATDAEDGTLPPSALTWTLIIHHCTTPTTCHIHDIQSWSGVSSGSLNAPDHSYPSYLELQLTATDSAKVSTTTSVSLQPKTVDLTFTSVPSGLSLAVDGIASTTPFTRTVIQKSANSLSATSPQTLNGNGYAFSRWSDGGAATHNIDAPTSSATYTATYTATVPGLVAAYAFAEGSGSTVADLSGNGNNGTLLNTTWAAAGKYGTALSFNGTSARVTIPDSASLHLSSAMTLEAWLNPATVTAAWRDVIYKGDDNYYLEGTSDSSGRPAGGGTFGHPYGPAALPANTWTHLAVTYDRTTIRLYVNGTQVSSLAATGAIASSSNPLSIGGDSIYGQYFSGLIDEVRVYNTALTAAQIQTDMATPVGN
jgi:glucose/arabinose dehydrogenase